MAIITVLTVLAVTVPLQVDEAHERGVYEQLHGRGRNTVSELDGKTLAVRVYADWKTAPNEFELVSLPIENKRVVIDPNASAVPFAVVVAGEDQQDEAVKARLGDYIGAWTVTKRFDLVSPFVEPPARLKPQWQFTDALGEPLPGATVAISVGEFGGLRIRLDRATLDDAGRLQWRALHGNLRMVYFTVSHPDYGHAEAVHHLGLNEEVVVPLVRTGTVAADRAIRGRVMAPSGRPVGGATIECSEVRTLGEGLINGLDNRSKGITDANGAFSFYMPNQVRRDRRGELIPPKSRYDVRIEAPKALGLLPYGEPIENGRESLIVLERGDRMRRFRFEDEDGEITDPARLERITVTLRRPDRRPLMLRHKDWKDGAALVPGTYEASMRGAGEECRFEPVEVTAESPDEVVFALPPAVTYYGRVVHGATGRPMAGAFVLAMHAVASDRRLCDLTRAEWDALHSLPTEPAADEPTLAPLRKMYAFTKVVRTDAEGVYTVTLEPEEEFYGFIAFERDFLAVMYRRSYLTPDEDRFAEVPPMKLFAAAKVLVEPMVDQEHVSIMPKWVIERQGRPAWVEDLLRLNDNRQSSLEYDRWLKPNLRQPVHIPAAVTLRLELETPYEEEFCSLPIPQPLYLMQGEVVDLGRFTLEPALPVQVRVVDSGGHALEGIPIRPLWVRDDGRHWGVPHITDEQGVSRFHVTPHSNGSFGVLYHGNGVNLKEIMEYRVGGWEDAEREFTFQISDEMLTYLLQ